MIFRNVDLRAGSGVNLGVKTVWMAGLLERGCRVGGTGLVIDE